jgi:hypothetical protein
MPVDNKHPAYDAALPAWERSRDVLSGEDAVKAAGEKYLPRLDSQTDEEYAAYRKRAAFFNAAGRTLEEYLDLVFRRAPVVSLGEGEGSGTRESSSLRGFVEDCDGWGASFVRFGRRVLSEVLSVGRGGSLVLCDEAARRPCVSFWRAEDIVNWNAQRVGQVVALVEVVLRDCGRLRVLKLVDSVCVQEFWKRVDETWVLEESAPLMRAGIVLPSIPFVFHGPRHSRPETDFLPLADLIAANLDHYRLDADYKHGLHFTALPTAWVSGFDKAAPLRIGSSSAWVSEVPGASAGFLEFSGRGLAHLERAIEKVERRMALMGARLVGSGSPSPWPSPPGRGELCGLGSIVASVNESLSRVLQLACWWLEGGPLGETGPTETAASFVMNTDLDARAMSGDEITAVVAAWRAGAISRDTMLERLKRGEVLPDGRTIADERALIHGKRQ